MSCNIKKELRFSVLSLSSSSLIATQWVLRMNSNLLCLTWLSSLINFALSLTTVTECSAHSLTTIFNLNFSFLCVQLRDLRKMSTHKCSWWVHSAHFEWSVIMMQKMSRDRQWSQKIEDEFSWRPISLKRARWFFDLESIAQIENDFWTYTLTYIWFRELASRREKMMLWSDWNRHSD